MAIDDPLKGAQRDAFEAMKGFFRDAGFKGADYDSLVKAVTGYVQSGYSGDTISLLLNETDAYKRRFKGNEERKKKGLPVLNPAEYLQMETSYKGLFRQYGLPAEMFDSSDDLTKYIVNEVSPSEMQDRLNLARSAVTSDNPAIRDTYRAWYASGLNEGDAIAAVLDPGRSLPEIERKVAAAQFGAAATRQSLALSQQRAEELAALGADTRDAVAAFGQVADIGVNAGAIASRYGLDYAGQRDAEDAVLLGDAAAARRVKRLGEREAAEFGGRGVADSRSFGRKSF